MKKQIVIDVEISDHLAEVTGCKYPQELDTDNLRELFNGLLAQFVPDLTPEQGTLLKWMKEQTKDVQLYSFHQTGIILEVAKGTKWVPIEIHQLWVEMLECDRQRLILEFLG